MVRQGHVLVLNLVSFVSSTPFHSVFYMILRQPGAINPRSAFPFHFNLPSSDFESVLAGMCYVPENMMWRSSVAHM